MTLHRYYYNDKLTRILDDEARTVTEWDEQGVQLPPRTYTPEENVEADARIAEEAAVEAERTLREEVKAIKADLQAEKARVQVVIDKANNQISGGDTKDVARAAKRIADAAISIAKLLVE